MHTLQESKTIIFHGKEIIEHLSTFLADGWQVGVTQDASGIEGYDIGARTITLVKDIPLPKKEEEGEAQPQ